MEGSTPAREAIYATEIWQPVNAATLRMRCPICGDRGTLDVLGIQGQDLTVTSRERGLHLGSRRCPNPECHAHIFVAYNEGGELIVSYPPEVIDFDATNLPDKVLAALVEAIQCHAVGSYSAAALMVRKTLEAMCENRGAEGANLKERIDALRGKVTLPDELIDGLQVLRLLGNDAGHVEARVYDEVGEDEARLAIEIAKQVLETVYQRTALVERLRNRKRQTAG